MIKQNKCSNHIPSYDVFAVLKSAIKYEKFVFIIGITKFTQMNEEVKQIIANQYLEPFKAYKRTVIGLAVELDEEGKGLIDWEEVIEE